MEKLLTAEELAVVMGVKLSTIYNWSHAGKLPRVKTRLLRFRESDVQKWLSGALSEQQKPVKALKKETSGKVRPGKRAAEIDRLVEQAKAEVL